MEAAAAKAKALACGLAEITASGRAGKPQLPGPIRLTAALPPLLPLLLPFSLPPSGLGGFAAGRAMR